MTKKQQNSIKRLFKEGVRITVKLAIYDHDVYIEKIKDGNIMLTDGKWYILKYFDFCCFGSM